MSVNWNEPPKVAPPPGKTKAGLTDQGPEYWYFKVSHRRRFWRTVYMAPLCVVIFFLPTVGDFVAWQVGLLITVLYLVQLGYEYYKWQEEKRDSQQS